MSSKKALLLAGILITALEVHAAKIEVQGHRGARAARPENTLVAFKYALKLGVDTLELDTVVTKDDQLVLNHELYLDPRRCLSPKGRKIKKRTFIRDLTLAQVKKYDCGKLRHPTFPKQRTSPGARIPSLEEVFKWINSSTLPKAKTVQFNIETKIVPGYPKLSPTPQKFAELMVALIKKYKLTERVVIQSFDHRTLQAVKDLESDIGLSALVNKNLPDLVALAQNLGAKTISPNLRWITAEDVKLLHEEGIRVIPWTANSREEWDYLVKIGVDGIITDDPKALLQYLKNKKL